MAPLIHITNDTAQAENRHTNDASCQDTAGESAPSGDHPASLRPSYLNLVSKNPSDSNSEGPKYTPKTSANTRHSYYDTPSMTPAAARTGPPRSLSFSYNYPVPSSLSSPNRNNYGILEEPRRPRPFTDSVTRDDPSSYDLTPRETQLRGPFDPMPSEQKDRSRSEAADRREKRKSGSRWDGFKSRLFPDALSGSPTEEISGIDWEKGKEKDDAPPSGGPSSRKVSSAVASGSGSGSGLARSVSMSTQGKGKERQDTQTQTQGSKSPSTGWSRLRFLLPNVVSPTAKERAPSVVTPGGVNITDELTVGGLSAIILRLWFERDERGRRRVPILLHRLRIRISDSLHPLQGAHSVFRIECEYANGAMRWVIYRQLRDFVSLHAHFAVSNAYNRNIEKLPEFPRTSMFS
jgi:phospholipase D1/2